ncbi:MAG: recombinase family protein [Ruminococcus flavefaciens]|nr:recombinase family protein [Ruminococcus flavefaciens]
MDNMENVVAYCRVSTNKESQNGSFETQKKFFVDYAEKNNLNLVHIYSDQGITGTSIEKRPGFSQMIKDSEKGIFKCVLVKDISRFSRNVLDLIKCIRQLTGYKINVKFITMDMNTIDGDELMLILGGMISQQESANLSKRIKFSKRVNASKGTVPNSCYGYIKINGEKYNMAIDEEQAKVVKEIFDLYVNGGNGTHKIAKILNERGIKSAKGRQWSTTAVSRTLKNKIYAGYVINGKTEVENFITKKRIKRDKSEWIEVENSSLRIIPLELWEKAQTINNSNNTGLEKTIHKKRSNKHLFSTLITCECCGYSFRRIQNKRKDYTRTYWGCSGRNRYGAEYCKNKTMIMEDELIENIDNYFQSLIKDRKKFVESIMNQYQKRQPESPEIELRKQLDNLQDLRQKNINLYMHNIIKFEEMQKKVADIDRQICEIKLKLDFIETPENMEKKLYQLYRMLSENFEKYSSVANMTNAELRTLIKGITTDENGNVNIELNY